MGCCAEPPLQLARPRRAGFAWAGDHQARHALVGAAARRVSFSGSSRSPRIRGYRFEVRSSHAIQVEPGKPVDLSVILYGKNLSAPTEERSAICYAEH